MGTLLKGRELTDKIKSLLNASRVNEVRQDYLEKEIWWCRCNPSDAETLLEMLASKLDYSNDCNSTLAYCLGVTSELQRDVPISSSPSVFPDFDFDTGDRDFVLETLKNTYGVDRMCLIGTYNSLSIKGAIKDITRVMLPDMKSADVNEITQRFDLYKKDEKTAELDFLDSCLEADPVIKSFMDKNPILFENLRNILGSVRSTSIHAGGVVVGTRPIYEVIPCRWDANVGLWLSQVDMNFVEYAKLIKYDFLRLQTLEDIQLCKSLVHQTTGKMLKRKDMGRDIKEVLQDLIKGKTLSLFQAGTDVQTDIFKRLNDISGLETISMVSSTGRPGPMKMGMVDQIINRSTGKEKVEYLHPLLEPILRNTYGVIIYQEQVLLVLQKIGGLSKFESSLVMKSMSKKIWDKVEKYKDSFLKGAEKHKIPKTIVDEIWKRLSNFAEYGFNKAHSIAYAAVTYDTAWLKHFYPLQWAASVLSNPGLKKPDFHAYCSEWGSIISPPSVNKSKRIYLIDQERQKVLMPIHTINSAGDKAVDAILKNQPYSSFEGFIHTFEKQKIAGKSSKKKKEEGLIDESDEASGKNPITKKVVYAMIFSGAFDEFNKEGLEKEIYRKGLVKKYHEEIALIKKLPPADRAKNAEFETEVTNYSKNKMLQLELSYLNMSTFDYESYFNEYMGVMNKEHFKLYSVMTAEALKKETRRFKKVMIVGALIEKEFFAIRSGKNQGKEMCKLVIATKGKTTECVCFPDYLIAEQAVGNAVKLRDIKEYTAVIIAGSVSIFRETVSLAVDRIHVIT